MQVWAPPPEGMIQLGWVGPRNGGKGISSGPGNGSQKSEKKTRDSWVTTQAERHCAELVRPCLASNKAHIAQRHPEAPSHPALERNSELTWSQAQSLRPPALLAFVSVPRVSGQCSPRGLSSHCSPCPDTPPWDMAASPYLTLSSAVTSSEKPSLAPVFQSASPAFVIRHSLPHGHTFRALSFIAHLQFRFISGWVLGAVGTLFPKHSFQLLSTYVWLCSKGVCLSLPLAVHQMPLLFPNVGIWQQEWMWGTGTLHVNCYTDPLKTQSELCSLP